MRALRGEGVTRRGRYEGRALRGDGVVRGGRYEGRALRMEGLNFDLLGRHASIILRSFYRPQTISTTLVKLEVCVGTCETLSEKMTLE